MELVKDMTSNIHWQARKEKGKGANDWLRIISINFNKIKENKHNNKSIILINWGNVRCDYETDDNITINQQYYVCSYEI